MSIEVRGEGEVCSIVLDFARDRSPWLEIRRHSDVHTYPSTGCIRALILLPDCATVISFYQVVSITPTRVTPTIYSDQIWLFTRNDAHYYQKLSFPLFLASSLKLNFLIIYIYRIPWTSTHRPAIRQGLREYRHVYLRRRWKKNVNLCLCLQYRENFALHTGNSNYRDFTIAAEISSIF